MRKQQGKLTVSALLALATVLFLVVQFRRSARHSEKQYSGSQ